MVISLPYIFQVLYVLCFTRPRNQVSVYRTIGPLVLSLFPQFDLTHFSGIFTIKVNREWVPCVGNSSYSFMPILLKLHRCFDHGLKTCMWFGCNPQIIFCHFFCNLNLVFFQALLLSTYVDSTCMYLLRVTPVNFTFSDDSLFL